MIIIKKYAMLFYLIIATTPVQAVNIKQYIAAILASYAAVSAQLDELQKEHSLLRGFDAVVNPKGQSIVSFDHDAQLMQAIEAGQPLQVIKELVAAGADINAPGEYGDSVLHRAVENNDLDLVQYLLEQKANLYALDVHAETPFAHAITTNRYEIVKYMIRAGVDCNNFNRHGIAFPSLLIIDQEAG